HGRVVALADGAGQGERVAARRVDPHVGGHHSAPESSVIRLSTARRAGPTSASVRRERLLDTPRQSRRESVIVGPMWYGAAHRWGARPERLAAAVDQGGECVLDMDQRAPCGPLGVDTDLNSARLAVEVDQGPGVVDVSRGL